MEKSFYYSIPWSEVSYLKEAMTSMQIPFVIEQPSNKLPLEEGEVAIVFPNMHVRVYNHVRELFNSHGLRYPE
ncbi:hypothetical protein [Brevibacillus choshinensis]|uniref:DUF2007 domain-containing protein n=1 Tax=Brevibacillus choshinensis TaxID=54911 RepID=A0ABX7FHL4_BRECH|nr:hypothetical protein [Brevibacillus choshinensis]QRG65273.1 hypothetical protein JNE38_16655 [Brevibacillus choshinensis]